MSRLKRQRVDLAGNQNVTSTHSEDLDLDLDRKDSSELNDEQANPQLPEKNPRQRRQRQRQQSTQPRSLFIRSLPDSITTEKLTDIFSEQCPVKHATVVVDSTTKVSKGYGFVTLADAEDVEGAIRKFHGWPLEDKNLKVELATARQRGGSKTESGADALAKIDSGSQEPGTERQVNKAASKNHHQQQRQQQSLDLSSKLIVRNLPWSIKKVEQLSDLFRSYGKIKQASLPQKKGPGVSPGFGFVMMRGHKNAEKAIEGVNGKVVDGRAVAVDWAVRKETWESLNAQVQSPPEDGEEVLRSDQEGVGDDGASGLEDSNANSKDADAMDVDEKSISDNDSAEDAVLDESRSDDDDDQTDETDQSVAIVTEPELEKSKSDNQSTVFIRNLPFTATDESLYDQFLPFGAIRYARTVIDHDTERPKGTGFVCFYDAENAINCLREAPKITNQANPHEGSHGTRSTAKHSILEDTSLDQSGRYTMEGRVLHISPAVDRAEALRQSTINGSLRDARDRDKRRLYLLSEGTVPSNSPLYAKLSTTDVKIREDSLKQRQSLIKSNPSLHLSLNRLAIRNLPRSITSKALKALAREAVVGYAADIKSGQRKQLTKEEEIRGGEDSKQAEKHRKEKGKGIVKQAKIIFEGREGGKVSEDSGAGRSRGYGFVEYSSHRWALMGMRWLNGHLVKPLVQDPDAAEKGQSLLQHPQPQQPIERGKRLIVEFAIENAQVVARRKERESKAFDVRKARNGGGDDDEKRRESGKAQGRRDTRNGNQEGRDRENTKVGSKRKTMDRGPLQRGRPDSRNRKRGADSSRQSSNNDKTGAAAATVVEGDEKLARRQQIIGRKRMMRKKKNGARTTK